MDFDDLLFRAVNLFELYEEVRDRYRRSFRHVLVDEYQDTNRAQYRWLQLLTEESRNLCVVGDDDQCLVEGHARSRWPTGRPSQSRRSSRAISSFRATAAATSAPPRS